MSRCELLVMCFAALHTHLQGSPTTYAISKILSNSHTCPLCLYNPIMAVLYDMGRSCTIEDAVTFEDLTAMTVKVTVVCDVTPCNFVGRY